MKNIINIDEIAPVKAESTLSQSERRLRVAIDSAASDRDPQGRMIKLINSVAASDLRTITHNTRMRMLAGLRSDGDASEPSSGATEARMRLYAGLDLPAAFVEQSRDLGNRIARHFLANQSGQPLDKAWSGKDEDARLDTIVELLHAYGHESGYPPPSRIETDEISPDQAGRIQTGEYRPETDVLWQNTHQAAGWDDAVEALTIAGHEATHKYQLAMSMRLMADHRPDMVGDMQGVGQPLANDDERIAAWYFMDNNFFGHISTGDQEIGYKFQPIEQHARLVENAIKQTLNRSLVLGLEDGLITGVTADDLNALGIDPDKLRADTKQPPMAGGQSEPLSPQRREQDLPRRRFG
jgi:hypothetical protein